jgi:hypothetical protein
MTTNRFKAIREKAFDSIGCYGGEGMEFEAKVMVEGLKQVRETIKTTDSEIKEICLQFQSIPISLLSLALALMSLLRSLVPLVIPFAFR